MHGLELMQHVGAWLGGQLAPARCFGFGMREKLNNWENAKTVFYKHLEAARMVTSGIGR